MDMDYLMAVGAAFLVDMPMLLAWLVGIVLAVRMLRRGGGKAERLLLIGCSLMFVAQISGPFLTGLPLLLHGISMTSIAARLALFRLSITILSTAGIVCLILAFWSRWKTSAATQ